MKIQSNAMDRIRQLNTRTLREAVGLQEVMRPDDPKRNMPLGGGSGGGVPFKSVFDPKNPSKTPGSFKAKADAAASKTKPETLGSAPSGRNYGVLRKPTQAQKDTAFAKMDADKARKAAAGGGGSGKPPTGGSPSGGGNMPREPNIPNSDRFDKAVSTAAIATGGAGAIAIAANQLSKDDKPTTASAPAKAASAPAMAASAPTKYVYGKPVAPDADIPKAVTSPAKTEPAPAKTDRNTFAASDSRRAAMAVDVEPVKATPPPAAKPPPPPPAASAPAKAASAPAKAASAPAAPPAAKPPTPASDEPKSRDYEYNDKTIPSAADVPLGGTIKGFNSDDRTKVQAFIAKAEKEKKENEQRAKMSRAIYSDESVQSKARSASFVFERIRNITEGRPSQRHPLEGHDYHKKSNDELVYIAKDAHKAAEAMKDHNTTAENKYRDQANDSATVRYYRQKNGMPDWYKKKYGHMKEDVMKRSPAATLRKDTGDTGDAGNYPSGKPVITGTDYTQSAKDTAEPKKVPVPSGYKMNSYGDGYIHAKTGKPMKEALSNDDKSSIALRALVAKKNLKQAENKKMSVDFYKKMNDRVKAGEDLKKEEVELQEAKEKTEYDYEGDMARGQLQSIISNAQRVHDMLEDNDNLAEWVQSKITLAEDYISTVANYMMSEVDEEVQQGVTEEITADDMARSALMQGFKHGREGSGNNMDRARAQHGKNFKLYIAGFLKGRNEKAKSLKAFGQGYNKKRPQPVAEEVEVGDKVSFNHPMTAAPGKTMKKVGTVHKVEDDTVHVKVKSKYGVMTHKKSASELTKEEFNIDEEVEELDELNKDTLYSYSKKAEVDQDKQFTTIGKGMRDNEPKSANKAGHKFSMRSVGINRADKRLQKEEQIEELSSNLLGRYKKSAGEQASAADKSGDYDKGNKRFSGIMKATKKQFANDTKQGVAESATGAKPGFMLRQDPDLAKKLKDQLARKKKLPQGADFAAQRRKERLASNGRMDEAVESHQEEWIDEAGPGLWANIHAKRQRIKQGSKERMRNPGEKGAPESGALEKARGTNEEVKGEYERKVDKYLKKKYAPDDNKAPPFDPPYAKMPKADKSGAIHSPMSRAKHLAKMAGKKQAGIKENSHDGQDNINTPAKRSLSKTAGMVKTILKGAKSKNKNLDKFESEPELSSQIVKQE